MQCLENMSSISLENVIIRNSEVEFIVVHFLLFSNEDVVVVLFNFYEFIYEFNSFVHYSSIEFTKLC